jgi:DNA polymerase IV
MRIACVYFPHFYIQAEKLKTPGLEGFPVIIGGTPEERNNVIDCSEEAAAQGVRPGMSLREAHHLCPDATFLPFNDYSKRLWEDVLFALGAFSLRIESEGPGFAYLDITKALWVYRSERTVARTLRDVLGSSCLSAGIGTGNSRFIAKQAALCAWDVLIVEPGEEKEFLSLLPAQTLPLSNKEKDHLRLLGLSNLKKIANLSRKALLSQFGLAGRLIWDIVNGIDEKRPIPKRESTICPEREFTSDIPIESSQELRPIIKEMITQLLQELNRMRMACRNVKLTLYLQDGRSFERMLVMKKPAAEGGRILVRLLELLDRLAVESPIISFRLSLPDPVPFEGDQEDLFQTRSIFAERLENIRGYFDARYGYTPLMRVEEQETDSRLPERWFRFTHV